AFLVNSVTETTRGAIRKAVVDALATGSTVDQLAARLEGLGEFSEARARLIALTETTRTLNGAADGVAAKFEQDTGRTVVATWNTQRDGRVRAAHRAQDRIRRERGKAFPNGVLFPSEPGCRCYLTYEVSE